MHHARNAIMSIERPRLKRRSIHGVHIPSRHRRVVVPRPARLKLSTCTSGHPCNIPFAQGTHAYSVFRVPIFLRKSSNPGGLAPVYVAWLHCCAVSTSTTQILARSME